jgi:hypothetical protein
MAELLTGSVSRNLDRRTDVSLLLVHEKDGELR